MKILGLIGGLSWISTIDYYRMINQAVSDNLGGLHSAKIHLNSVDFQEFYNLVQQDKWADVSEMLSQAAVELQSTGAKAIVICANTPHMVADQVQQSITIPLIHIATVTADEILKHGIQTIGLIGTKLTMEEQFFREKLDEKQIKVITPDSQDRQYIHDVVFNELGKGLFMVTTRTRFLEIINNLICKGARGIILGCTEFPYLISTDDVSVPLFDTANIHAKAAAKFSLNS